MSILYSALFAVFCSGLVCSSALAADYALTMGVMPSAQETAVQNTPDYFSDIEDFDEWQDMPDEEWEEYVAEVDAAYYGVASPSSATPSVALYSSDGPGLYSSYSDVYEGSISSSILDYFKGIVEKLGPDLHYVLFRQDRYYYRLVISPDLTYQNGVFTAPADGCEYVLYYSYDSTVSAGQEGSFRLDVNSYTVYSDLESPYPVLTEGVRGYEFKTLVFSIVVLFLFIVFRDIFKLCGFSFRQ